MIIAEAKDGYHGYGWGETISPGENMEGSRYFGRVFSHSTRGCRTMRITRGLKVESAEWSGFPYNLLVRVPLCTLVPMAALLVCSRAESGLRVAPTWLVVVLIGSLICFWIGALVQIVAMPVGLYFLYKSGRLLSVRHNLALVCGALHLALAAYLAIETGSVE